MSRENIEIVRRIFDSVSRGEVDQAIEAAADDFEVDWSNSVGSGMRPVTGTTISGLVPHVTCGTSCARSI